MDRHLRPNQPAAFSLPEGMPPEMLVYDRFAEERGWTPAQVRGLTRQELFWLPVVAAAKREAAKQIAAADEKK